MKKNSGQAAVEYVLIVFLVVCISVGTNKLFVTAFQNYYKKILDFRSNVKGMSP